MEEVAGGGFKLLKFFTAMRSVLFCNVCEIEDSHWKWVEDFVESGCDTCQYGEWLAEMLLESNMRYTCLLMLVCVCVI